MDTNKFTDAYFDATTGAHLMVDGRHVSLGDKINLLMEGLCVVTGDWDAAATLNTTESTVNPNVLACANPRLVELAARYWLWSNQEDAIEGVQEILDEDEARLALNEHRKALGLYAMI